MSTLDVVAEVLREVAPRALKAREIAALAGNRLPTASRTPETVVSRDLAVDVRDYGAASRFLRVDRGAFVLKEALPTAFYNDNDSYAAQWTRNLIAAGEIAAGVVDERSIRDLKPADVASFRQCHFFSGIGVWSRALRDAKWPDDANVWSGSCPCVPFSSAGRKRGFSDEQHLWPAWFRLISACRPSAVIGEQVSSKDGLAWLDLVCADLEGAGYSIRALDIPTASVGGPHARQRLYFVAYARERGREIIGAPWLHDHWQPGDDAARCSTAHGGVPSSVFDTVRSDGTLGMGNTSLSRSGRNAGALPGTEAASEEERLEAWDLSDKSVAASADDGTPRLADGSSGLADGSSGLADGSSKDLKMVRGAAGDSGDVTAREHSFTPGECIRLDDPSWGGAVKGFWADSVEWIYCRPEPGHEDGRWRPVESGTLPLVDGTAPRVGRTRASRLRCYGNAIVRPLAVAFITSVIDTFIEAAQSLRVPVPAASSDPTNAPEIGMTTADVHAKESAA